MAISDCCQHPPLLLCFFSKTVAWSSPPSLLCYHPTSLVYMNHHQLHILSSPILLSPTHPIVANLTPHHGDGWMDGWVLATGYTCCRYFDKMDMLHSYMKHRRFPPDLRHRVHRYFRKFFEVRSPDLMCALLGA